MKECSEKYKAANAAGNTKKWNEFRKSECGADTAATPTAAPSGTPAQEPATPAAEAKPAKKAKKAAKTEDAGAPPAAPAAAGEAVFPSAVSDKYKSETAGKARMHTCLDQYKANGESGANNQNGGLKWIQKGGGYYSQCNKRLKGA